MHIKAAWRVLWRGPDPIVYHEPEAVETVLIVDQDVKEGHVYALQGHKRTGYSGYHDKGYYLTCADAFSDSEINDLVVKYDGFLSLDKTRFYCKSDFQRYKGLAVTQQGNNKKSHDGDPYLRGCEA